MRCVPLRRRDGDGGGDATGPSMKAILARCRAAALGFSDQARSHTDLRLLLEPNLDIVAYFARAERASEITAATDRIFEAAAASTEAPLHLAKLEVEAARFLALCPDVAVDVPKVRVLRSCLMKPEQATWVERIVGGLESAIVPR